MPFRVQIDINDDETDKQLHSKHLNFNVENFSADFLPRFILLHFDGGRRSQDYACRLYLKILSLTDDPFSCT